MRKVVHVMGYPPANFGDTTTIRFRFMGHWAHGSDWSRDCDFDFWPWRSWRLWLMRVVVLHPYITFEVRRPCRSEDWRTMCVSINGPGDPDLWPFDLETGMRVASTVGTFLPNFGTLGLWVLELFAMYATDRQTDGQTDGQKQRLFPLTYGRGHNKFKPW